MENLENAKSFSAQIENTKRELSKDVVGSKEIIENIIIAIIAINSITTIYRIFSILIITNTYTIS